MMMKVDMWTTAKKHYGMNNMWEIILIWMHCYDMWTNA